MPERFFAKIMGASPGDNASATAIIATVLQDHLKLCDDHNKDVDRKLDKIEEKLEERHQENRSAIAELDAKLDAIAWKVIGAAGAMILTLVTVLTAILRTKIGL